MQRTIDGAIARFYRLPEWKQLVTDAGLTLEKAEVMGQKTDLVLLPAGAIKDRVLALLPDALGRFFTNTCRMGYFLVATMRKR